MRRLMLRAGAAFVLGLGLVVVLSTSPRLAAEDTKPDPKQDTKPSTETAPIKEPAPKPPTFPGYVFVTDVVGEVVKADDKTIKLRVTWFVPQMKGGNNKRPNLHQNAGNYRNPFAANHNRPQNQPQWKEQHHDYDLDYLPQSLVRVHSLPAKLDEKGKKIPYTTKEYDQMRIPVGVIGYAADKSDVVPGTFLQVFLLRDKTIPEAKVTDADLRIKYALIWGKDPTPPKDIGGTNPPTPKKN